MISCTRGMKCLAFRTNRGNKIIAQICWARYAGFTIFKLLMYDDSQETNKMTNKMKAIQLGCGVTGLVCAEHLAKNQNVEALTLADIRIDDAEDLAGRLSNDKISVQKVDARDGKALKRLMKDADIVVSSISWMLNHKVMDVALQTGTNYVDFSLTLDWDELDDPKKFHKDADITILSCVGSDPGMTDVFARYSADQLDQVDRIRITDSDIGLADGCDFFSVWSPNDLMDELGTPAGVFRNGKWDTIPPLHERQIYEFPQPIGPQPVYNTDHEETHIMASGIINPLLKGVKNVDFRLGIDDNLANIARVLKKTGMLNSDPVDVKGVKVVPLDVLVALMPHPRDLIDRLRGFSIVNVETTGMQKGKKKMIKMWVAMSHEKAYRLYKSNGTGYLVGTGGAIGAEMIIDGEISQKGLMFPEQIPAKRFLDKMKEKGLEIHEQSIDLQ